MAEGSRGEPWHSVALAEPRTSCARDGSLGGTSSDDAPPECGLQPSDAERLHLAVTRLERLRPDLSARLGLTARQKTFLGTIAILGGSLEWLDPSAAMLAVQALLAFSFALLLAIRLLAIWVALTPVKAPSPRPLHRCEDALLPVYTVLVALYDEAAVVPQLVAALAAIDYPPGRLDIIVALEAGDGETLAALERTNLTVGMRTIVVPVGRPRTKPRALCYALTYARGAFVVVYDAEDQPEPGQLREAVAAFAAGEGTIGCLQARLNIYNRRENWLTAQFAIEYTALFDAVLPAYARYRLPVPLGGTSNHFPGIRQQTHQM